MIIPTYRDWDRLKLCVDALAQQSYPADLVEILVVNNDADAPTPDYRWPARVRLLDEPQPGSYAARNRGLAEARGEVIAFTDSDCLPDRQWIENAVCHLQAGHDRVAGRVQLVCESPRRTLVEAHQLVFAFNQPRHARAGACVTANLVAWKHCFTIAGKFDPELMSGGDMEWGYRASSKGLDILYAPDAVVAHPARATLAQLLGKQRRVVGAVTTLKKYNPERLWLIRAFLPPFKAAWRISRSRELSFSQKLGVFWLSYLLKITGAYYRACMQLGITRARRA